MTFSAPLSKKELKYGLVYLGISLILIPLLLALLPLREGQMNGLYYLINFTVITLILRRFLLENFKIAINQLFPVLYYGALGYLGYEAFGRVLTVVTLNIDPEFLNINDQSIYAMLQEDFLIMAIGTVLLAPVAEECFFRGLIFRGMYDRNPVFAYVLSMVMFSAIHVAGYLGTVTTLQFLLCFIQYLPAGYCLCFAYRHSGTIVSPILLHTFINALGIASFVR